MSDLKKQLEEYRKNSSQRYNQINQSGIELDRERELELERKLESDVEMLQVYEFLDEWDKEMDLMVPVLEYISTLPPRISMILPLCKKHDMMMFLSDRVVRFVDMMNRYHESNRSSASDVQLLHNILKTIIQLTEVEVDIEMMDTSIDEKIALELQETFYEHLDLYQEEVNELQALPICSVTRRIGLNVVQLKELAKQHNISTQGTKSDLCNRLFYSGLVQIV